MQFCGFQVYATKHKAVVSWRTAEWQYYGTCFLPEREERPTKITDAIISGNQCFVTLQMGYRGTSSDSWQERQWLVDWGCREARTCSRGYADQTHQDLRWG